MSGVFPFPFCTSKGPTGYCCCCVGEFFDPWLWGRKCRAFWMPRRSVNDHPTIVRRSYDDRSSHYLFLSLSLTELSLHKCALHNWVIWWGNWRYALVATEQTSMGLHSKIEARQQCNGKEGREEREGRCVGSVHPVSFNSARCACCKNRKTKATIEKIVKILISACEWVSEYSSHSSAHIFGLGFVFIVNYNRFNRILCVRVARLHL